MKHFFQKLDKIDSILQNGASRENAESLVALMTDSASRFYVFDKIDGSWLEPLESIGYFRQLSSGIGGSKDEPTAFLPASAYLKKIAADAGANGDLAQTLQRVLSFIPEPGNFYSFRDIVDTSLLLPREMRRGIVPFIQRAIGNKLSIEFSNITMLITKLAEDGEVAAATRLFASIFSVFPVSVSQSKFAKDSAGVAPRSFLDPWHYKEQLEKCLPTLTRIGGLRFLPCLCQLLADYQRLDNSRSEFQGPDDLSYIWRPAIEVHAQNANDDIRDALVTAIRDSAESIVSETPANFLAVAEFLDSQQWFIFTRLLLHILGTSAGAPLNLIAHYSTQPCLFSEVTVRHEYSLLLKKRFRVLTREHQNAVLKMIENGPDRLSYITAMGQHNNEPPTKEDVEDYVNSWKLDWLSFIAEDLPADWVARYEALRKELPPPSHPEFPYFVSSVFGLAGRLPSAEQRPPGDAGSETIGELLDRILGIKLEGSGATGTDLDHLMEELQTVAGANPRSTLERVDEIEALPPRYLAAIVMGLANRSAGADSDLMSLLMRLGTVVAGRIRGTEHLADKESLRNCLTGVLDQFFRDDNQPLEAEHLQRLREMAESLLSTVTLASGQQAYGDSEDFDPLFWAINSVDGRIVENAVKVALRDRKRQGDIDCVEPQWLLNALSHLLAIMPQDEVRITAILGYRFPWLVHLSKAWATNNAEAIFPRSPECRWRWEAAWCTYVGFSGAYNDVLEILHDQYAKAVSEVSTKHIFKKSRLDPDKGLAQHLAIYYWRQLLTLHDPIFVEFLALGGKEPVSAFIGSIGQGMGQVNDFPENIADSLRRLAEWMVSDWRPRRKGARKALAAFGWWFPHHNLGEASWRLKMLRRAAMKAGEAENIDRVLKELDLLASEKPAQVVECLKGLVNGVPKESSTYFLASESFGILEKAASVANASTSAKIAEIADYFGANGHFNYRRFAQASND